MTTPKEIVSCGLDGVLALIEHRLHHLYNEEGIKHWDRFLAACGDDMPNLPLIERLNQARAEGVPVILLTGRSSAVKRETVEWLQRWQIGYDGLWMRPSQDFKPAGEYKTSVIAQHFANTTIRRVYESDTHIDLSPGAAVQLLRQFMKSHFPNGKVVEMVVGGDPCSGTIDCTTADGVMLVGDAARQTDPLTGGGNLSAMQAGIIAGDVAAKALEEDNVSKSRLKEYEDRWRDDIGRHLNRSYEFKEFFVKLTDDDLNKLIGSLKKEDISKMDLRGLLRVLLRLNPKLLWELRHLVV